MATIAFKYGAFWPKDWADDCLQHMAMQTELWNELVKIHHETGDAIRALTPTTASLEEATHLLDDLKAEAAELEERIKSGKVARHFAKGKGGDDSDTLAGDRVRLTDVRKALKEAAQRRVQLAKAARSELAADQVAAAYDQQHRRIKEARQAAAAKGLWWGNYNAVLTSFDGAKSKIVKAGGDLKEKYFRGEGRLTVQIQGGATPEELFAPAGSGGRNEARLIDGPPPGWVDRRGVQGHRFRLNSR